MSLKGSIHGTAFERVYQLDTQTHVRQLLVAIVTAEHVKELAQPICVGKKDHPQIYVRCSIVFAITSDFSNGCNERNIKRHFFLLYT